jgi:hypothetical protein
MGFNSMNDGAFRVSGTVHGELENRGKGGERDVGEISWGSHIGPVIEDAFLYFWRNRL